MDTMRRINLQGSKIIGIINKHSLAVFIQYANQLCDGLTAVLISVTSFLRHFCRLSYCCLYQLVFLQFVLAQEVTGSLNCFYNLMLDSN